MKRFVWLVVAWALFSWSASCSLLVEDGAGSVDGDTDSDSDSDGDVDTGLGGEPPAAPVLTGPEADARVVSPIRVIGTGEPDASVVVTLLDGSSVVSTANGEVDEDGNFRVDIEFSGVSTGTQLTVRAVLSNEFGSSGETEVQVKYEPIFISGNVSGYNDMGAGMDPYKVYVRVYESETEAIDYIDEVFVVVPSYSAEFDVPFTVEVGDGTYYLRAFFDTSGPGFDDMGGGGGSPDGQPTIGGDRQSGAHGPIIVNASVTSDITDQDLVVDYPMMGGVYLQMFNVYTNNERGPYVPEERDMNGNPIGPGNGLCGGYHLKIAARMDFMGMGGLPPQVRLPDGSDIELLNDGGCGNQGDNTSLSYDNDWPFDMGWSVGWPDPTDDDIGEYVLHYHDIVSDHINVSIDNVDNIVKLDRFVRVDSPRGDVANSTQPEVRWQPVPGALSYRINFERAEYFMCCAPNPGYRIEGDLFWDIEMMGDSFDDVAAYRMNFEIYDAREYGPSGPMDFDAKAWSIDHHFIVDQNGVNSSKVTGNIENNTGETGDIHVAIEAGDMDNFYTHSSGIYPPNATGYSLMLLTSPMPAEAEVRGFIDVADTGDNDGENRAFSAGAMLDLGGSSYMQDLVFTPPVYVISPDEGEMDVSRTPTFEWEDFSDNVSSEPWSYVLYMGSEHDGGGEGPEFAWGVPNSDPSFELASTDAIDIMYFLGCAGSISGGKCPAPEPPTTPRMLDFSTVYFWGIAVVPCAYGTTDAELMAYISCVQPIFEKEGSGSLGFSGETKFSTQP